MIPFRFSGGGYVPDFILILGDGTDTFSGRRRAWLIVVARGLVRAACYAERYSSALT
jgi:hypothetical protein